MGLGGLVVCGGGKSRARELMVAAVCVCGVGPLVPCLAPGVGVTFMEAGGEPPVPTMAGGVVGGRSGSVIDRWMDGGSCDGG